MDARLSLGSGLTGSVCAAFRFPASGFPTGFARKVHDVIHQERGVRISLAERHRPRSPRQDGQRSLLRRLDIFRFEWPPRNLSGTETAFLQADKDRKQLADGLIRSLFFDTLTLIKPACSGPRQVISLRMNVMD
jgi:hypothetical protein